VAEGVNYVKAPSADQVIWQMKGLCSSGDYDPELWAAQVEGERVTAKHQRHKQAQQICTECPVRRTCAEWALQSGEQYGVWGGLTESDRRAALGIRRTTYPRSA
jgi:WhiB family redox-sensing transcriptional regulator